MAPNMSTKVSLMGEGPGAASEIAFERLFT